MRAGWNEQRGERAGTGAADGGCGRRGRHRARPHGRAVVHRARRTGTSIARVAAAVSIPVFGNGDCVEPDDLFARLRSAGVAGVLVGRGVLRNPWIFAQAAALAEGRARSRRVARRYAAGSCSTTSTCCFAATPARPRASATGPAGRAPRRTRGGAPPSATAGSSTSCARCPRGTRGASPTAHSCATRSTTQTRWPRSNRPSGRSSAASPELGASELPPSIIDSAQPGPWDWRGRQAIDGRAPRDRRRARAPGCRTGASRPHRTSRARGAAECGRATGRRALKAGPRL